MAWTWLDLTLFTGTVYGIAWLITQSKLTQKLRESMSDVPFIGSLIQCIVCVATWIALGLALALPSTTLFSPGFRVRTFSDAVVLTAWGLAATWAIGRSLGDAYKDDAQA